jgi:ATP-dependent RNA helicase RhlE
MIGTTMTTSHEVTDTIAAIAADNAFAEFGLCGPLLQALEYEKYTVPTPIQAQALPVVLAGKDMIALAQTGTGKTAAFTLPMLHRLHVDKKRASPQGCRALILTPTRELAMQILSRVNAYGGGMKIRATVIVGGMPMGPQVGRMGPGVDIIVATPGRLLDHMEQRTIHLRDTEIVVLDEADQMMDMGFAPALKQIAAALPTERQTLLFSATMPSDMRTLAKTFVRNPVEIKTATADQPLERVKQKVFLVNAPQKRAKATQLLALPEVTSAIVFVRTKYGADRLEAHLNNYGIVAVAIHGDKSQGRRTRALAQFKAGKVAVMVATDVAARGIDVSNVSHVLNYEMPNVPETYLHRIGRTARAGAEGIAWSLVDGAEKKLLRDVETMIKMKIYAEDARQERIELPEVNKVSPPFDRDEQFERGGRRARGDVSARRERPERGDRSERRGSAERSGERRSSFDPIAAEKPYYSPEEKKSQSASRPGKKQRERAARRPEEAGAAPAAPRQDYRPRGDDFHPRAPRTDGAPARRDARPFSPRPSGDRPSGDRPSGDRPAYRPERPADSRGAPRDDRRPARSAEPRGEFRPERRPERPAAPRDDYRPERRPERAPAPTGDTQRKPGRQFVKSDTASPYKAAVNRGGQKFRGNDGPAGQKRAPKRG